MKTNAFILLIPNLITQYKFRIISIENDLGNVNFFLDESYIILKSKHNQNSNKIRFDFGLAHTKQNLGELFINKQGGNRERDK